VLVTGHEEIDNDGLDMVAASAVKVVREGARTAGTTEKKGLPPRAEPQDTPEAVQTDAPMPREAVLLSISKYRCYLRNRQEIDRLFSRWDIDQLHHPGLDRQELLNLITNKEKTLPASQKREVNGMIIDIVPTESDIAYIMDQSDANSNGLIDRSELLPALAMWAELAEQKEQAAAGPCGCMLL